MTLGCESYSAASQKRGFAEEVSTIGIRLELILSVCRHQSRARIPLLSEELLQQIVEHALKGIEATNLRFAKRDTADFVHALLNEAWKKFWSDPENFVGWEKCAVSRLFELPGTSQAITVCS